MEQTRVCNIMPIVILLLCCMRAARPPIYSYIGFVNLYTYTTEGVSGEGTIKVFFVPLFQIRSARIPSGSSSDKPN